MKKSFIVDSTCNDMRLDRWLKVKIEKIPQGLIEKYLRNGKIKIIDCSTVKVDLPDISTILWWQI